MQKIYLDNNATTVIAPEVYEAMQPYLKEWYGNPSSMHSFGSHLYYKIENAREKVAKLIGANPDEIIFTSGGTESDNTAIANAINANEKKRHIVTTQVEHPAILTHVRNLEKKGCRATYLPVDMAGRLDMDAFNNALADDTAIVSIMYANNETGVLFPVEKIAAVCQERGILFHTDAVQAAGKIHIDVKTLGVDMLSMAGHKMHAPKGIGVLYVRKGCTFTPYVFGGHQEDGQRAGTENVASIIALGEACDLALKNIEYEQRIVAKLRNRMEEHLLKTCSDTYINGCDSERLSNTSNISFSNINGETLLRQLDQQGVFASAGSACSAGSASASHVLRAMAVPENIIHGSIRFSLSRYTTDKEINSVINLVPEMIRELRSSI